MIKFEQTGRRPASSDASHADPRVAIDGEKLYRLVIDDRVVREGMTLDEVIAEIHRSDESIGERHSPSQARNDATRGRVAMRPVREPAAERRRMARREPGEHR